MKVEIRYDDRDVQRALNRLRRASSDLRPVMREISKHLVDSAHGNLERQAAPDGTPWAPLKPATLADREREGYTGPILQRVGSLFDSIHAFHDDKTAAAGTNLVYAAIHQFGGLPDMPPGPRGVPARPFLGVHDDDRDMILDAVREHLKQAVQRRSSAGSR